MAYAKKDEVIAEIKPANLVEVPIFIKGTAPLVINKFSNKAKEQMMATMATPKNAKKAKSERAPRDYEQDFQQAQHVSVAGWHGIPCVAFRAAMIDACRTAGVVMTRAKMSIFVLADGFDKDEGTPLIKIISPNKSYPKRIESLVRNDNGGADIRIRPQWPEWSAVVRLQFDADMMTPESVFNLLDRAGRQVGICEGRPFSKNSVGQGWGTFTVDIKETMKLSQNDKLKKAS